MKYLRQCTYGEKSYIWFMVLIQGQQPTSGDGLLDAECQCIPGSIMTRDKEHFCGRAGMHVWACVFWSLSPSSYETIRIQSWGLLPDHFPGAPSPNTIVGLSCHTLNPSGGLHLNTRSLGGCTQIISKP